MAAQHRASALERGSRPDGDRGGFTIGQQIGDGYNDTVGLMRDQHLVSRYRIRPGIAPLMASLAYGRGRNG